MISIWDIVLKHLPFWDYFLHTYTRCETDIFQSINIPLGGHSRICHVCTTFCVCPSLLRGTFKRRKKHWYQKSYTPRTNKLIMYISDPPPPPRKKNHPHLPPTIPPSLPPNTNGFPVNDVYYPSHCSVYQLYKSCTYLPYCLSLESESACWSRL